MDQVTTRPRIRPRIRVVLAGFAAGLSVVVASIAAYVLTRSPARGFADTFDSNLVQSQPLLGPLIEADPALRALMMRRLTGAYAEGGWPAASRLFHSLANSEMAAYADDAPILACNAAWQEVRRSLRDRPEACRAYGEKRYDAPGVRTAMAVAQTPCDAAKVDGARRRQTLTSPDIMSDAEFASTYAWTLRALPAAEQAALTGSAAEDSLVCQAGIDLDQAVAALPKSVAGRYARTSFRQVERVPVNEPVIEAPPPELHCATPGTIFTLSMEGSDGRPITWKSLGQRSWGCEITSSATGERPLLGTDAENPLRLLWPLAVGKTALSPTSAGAPDTVVRWQVAGEDRFWVPWGWARAFTLEQDVTEGNGRHYVVTHYWSPEIGFEIGQRARAISGSLPDWMAPNWQVIARDDDVGDRGAILSQAAAEADIRFALARAEAIHPDLYWYARRDHVQAAAEAAVAALSEQVSAMDLYVALSNILGLLGDGHISLSRPPGHHGDVLASYGKSGGRLLTIGARRIGGGLRLFWSGTDGLAAGDVITSINGQVATVLFERAMALEPGEPAFKERLVEGDFPEALWDLGITGPFELEGVFQGLPGRIKVAGRPVAAPVPAPPDEDAGLTLRELPDGVFLLTFRRMTAARTLFKQRLSALFTQIGDAHAKGLVIDIRSNGGGNSGLGDDLLDYISDRPRRGFARMAMRASPECRAYFPAKYGGGGRAKAVEEMADGEMTTRDLPVDPPAPNALRFAGPVAVLIGPGTFSAANMLANEIGDFGLAMLIGRDTAEIPNNYGDACPVLLPNSFIELRVPSTNYIRADGDAASREDVHPGIVVVRPGDGPGGDVDLEAARRWLNKESR